MIFSTILSSLRNTCLYNLSDFPTFSILCYFPILSFIILLPYFTSVVSRYTWTCIVAGFYFLRRGWVIFLWATPNKAWAYSWFWTQVIIPGSAQAIMQCLLWTEVNCMQLSIFIIIPSLSLEREYSVKNESRLLKLSEIFCHVKIIHSLLLERFPLLYKLENYEERGKVKKIKKYTEYVMCLYTTSVSCMI